MEKTTVKLLKSIPLANGKQRRFLLVQIGDDARSAALDQWLSLVDKKWTWPCSTTPPLLPRRP